VSSNCRKKSEDIVGLSTTKEVVGATEDTPAAKEGLDFHPRKNNEPKPANAAKTFDDPASKEHTQKVEMELELIK